MSNTFYDRLDLKNKVAINVVLKRKQLGLSQTELADKDGLSRYFLSCIETASSKNISIPKLEKIAIALGCEVNDLTGSVYDCSPLSKKIGVNILLLRKERGLTQEELGKLVGLSAAQVAFLESGERHTGVQIVGAIAQALNCEISELIP